jgi:hypothetical protein
VTSWRLLDTSPEKVVAINGLAFSPTAGVS